MDSRPVTVKRFVYLYFNHGAPEKIRRVVPAHVSYWKSAELKEYLGGPFDDRSGGLITFVASSLEEANAIVQQDPFVKAGLIAEMWVKQWLPE